jgi:hypothetical protein
MMSTVTPYSGNHFQVKNQTPENQNVKRWNVAFGGHRTMNIK